MKVVADSESSDAVQAVVTTAQARNENLPSFMASMEPRPRPAGNGDLHAAHWFAFDLVWSGSRIMRLVGTVDAGEAKDILDSLLDATGDWQLCFGDSFVGDPGTLPNATLTMTTTN